MTLRETACRMAMSVNAQGACRGDDSCATCRPILTILTEAVETLQSQIDDLQATIISLEKDLRDMND